MKNFIHFKNIDFTYNICSHPNPSLHEGEGTERKKIPLHRRGGIGAISDNDGVASNLPTQSISTIVKKDANHPATFGGTPQKGNEGKETTIKQNLIFSNLSLQISRGEKVGLVGQTGAGKTTLINLLLKNFAITNYKYWDRASADKVSENDEGGDIIINKQSIYDVTSDSLRTHIALIPQDIMLFHRSIGENISYAKENATQEEIINASKKAHIHEFISSLEQGYDTLVGERGIKLSGGQRQRIAIARAILKNAPILILDEATSSLDSKTERDIQASLNLLIEDKSKTVIAIAHRLSTLKHMDRIIVLNKGMIVEEGTHDELLANTDSLYKRLWALQEI